MKKQKAKLLACLLAASCSAVCFSAGVAVSSSVATEITASAETTYTVNSLTFLSGSATEINAYPNDGSGKPDVGSWDHVYTCQSGGGVQLNGVAIDATIKFPHDFYIALNATVATGDVLTIDGTFYNAEKDTYFVFNNCALQFNGTGWEVYVAPVEPPVVEYTTHEIGALILHVNSTIGGASGLNNTLYLQRADEGALPVLSWDDAFAYESGDGFRVNGEARTPSAIKSTGDGFYWEFDALNAGDVVSISGTFVCDTQAAKYVITESKFVWNGTGWEAYVEPVEPETPVEYTVYNIEKVNGANGCSASVLYAYSTDGDAFPEGDWDNVYTFEAGSGAGLTLNGEALSTTDIKQPGDFFINLGVNAVAGDVLTIDGAYYNNTTAKKFVFNNCTLTFDGNTWVGETVEEPVDPPVDPPVVEYTTHEIGALILHSNSTVGGASGLNNTLYLQRADEGALPVLSWDDAFAYESGDGFRVNGEARTPNAIKSTGDGFYWEFDALNAGDVVSISGTFVCDTQAAKYVITESKFVWNGSGWEAYVEPEEPETPVEYTVYNIEKVNGANGCSASVLYAYSTDGDAFPEGDWDNVYTFEAESGAGLKLNDTALSTTDIKQPGDFFINLGVNAVVGDVLTIDGAYYNNTTAKKFVFNNCTLTFDGSTWVGETVEDPVDPPVEPPVVEYTVYNIEKVNGANGCSASVLYAYSTDGDAFPEGDWDNVYTFEAGSGAGLKLNDTALSTTDIKQPGDFFINLGVNAVVGDVLTIDGAYYNNTTAKKFVFNNCTLTFDGSTWVGETAEEPVDPPVEPPVVEYTTHELGAVAAVSGDTGVYLSFAEGISLPVDSWDHAFAYESGNGITFNGEMVYMENNLKSVGNKLYVTVAVELTEGDTLVIGGVFYNAELGVKYEIEETEFAWNGRSWVTSLNYTTYELGELIFHVNSTVGGASDSNTSLYLKHADDETLPVNSWEDAYIFFYEEGAGLKVNGEEVTLLAMKSVGEFIYLEFEALQAGDVVSFGGTYACDGALATYIIDESKYVWNGTGWEPYVEYVTYEVGKVAFVSAGEGAIYVNRADGVPFEIVSTENNINWETAFSLLAGSGVGITLNGVAIDMSDIKFPHDMYIGLGGVELNEDDVLVIGGTFYSPTLGVKYVIEESTMIYDGTTWLDTFVAFKNDQKAELDAYRATFAEADYYDVQWAELDAALESGKAAIDGSKTEEEVTAAVAAAKSAMDSVLNKTALEASLADVKVSAKAEIAAYKAQKDYNDAEWTTIQNIISDANAKIDNAKSEETIVNAVTDAKSAMDEVATAQEIAEAQLKTWRADAKKEVQDYYQALDLSQYTDENNATLSGYVAAARTAIDQATDKAAIDEIVATFKTNVDSVAKKGADDSQVTQDSDSSDDANEGGCFSVAGGSAALGALGLAAAVALRKKKENN